MPAAVFVAGISLADSSPFEQEIEANVANNIDSSIEVFITGITMQVLFLLLKQSLKKCLNNRNENEKQKMKNQVSHFTFFIWTI